MSAILQTLDTPDGALAVGCRHGITLAPSVVHPAADDYVGGADEARHRGHREVTRSIAGQPARVVSWTQSWLSKILVGVQD